MNIMIGFIKNCFIPRYHNSFYPYFLRKGALAFYTVIILGLNVLVGAIGGVAHAGEVSASTLIEYANSERRARGLNELAVDPRLVAAAYEKAENMFELQYWSHYGPSGETPWQFITGSGYDYVYAGENLAKGFNSSEGVHSAWMASKTHRENILNSKYDEIGIAVVPGKLNGSYILLVVQMFGSVGDGSSATSTVSSVSPGVSSVNPKLEIIYPSDGQILGDDFLEIEGVSGDGVNNIEIYDNGDKQGRIIPQGGVWDYRPESSWEEGNHEVKAVDSVSEVNDSVDFVIDTMAPKIEQNSISVSQKTGVFSKLKVEVDISGDPDEVFVVINGVSKNLENDSGHFVGEVPAVSFEEGSEAKIMASDSAGNYSVMDISDYVLGVSSISEGSAVLGSINLNSGIKVFNKVVVIGVLLFLLFDAVYLFKLNIFTTRGRTLFPMAIWILVLGIGLAVGSGGTIY
ncbi:hypothetical protein JW710_03065 [Candidatus Dojkabacteria bacterium]|nr:hypothetical protein [Candidatus Dojkabacteria bacterium]